jgi:YD repeat-containing protein
VPNGLMYCSVDPVHYQASVTCPAYGATHVTGTSTSTYDSAGDQTSQTDADGNTTTSAYSVAGHPGLVSSSTDADGTTTTDTYNTQGQVTQKVAKDRAFEIEAFGAWTAKHT